MMTASSVLIEMLVLFTSFLYKKERWLDIQEISGYSVRKYKGFCRAKKVKRLGIVGFFTKQPT